MKSSESHPNFQQHYEKLSRVGAAIATVGRVGTWLGMAGLSADTLCALHEDQLTGSTAFAGFASVAIIWSGRRLHEDMAEHSKIMQRIGQIKANGVE